MSNGAPASPTPEAVLAARKRAGLTQVAAGALIYRNVRRWQEYEYGERNIDRALWELWQYRAGLITANELKNLNI